MNLQRAVESNADVFTLSETKDILAKTTKIPKVDVLDFLTVHQTEKLQFMNLQGCQTSQYVSQTYKRRILRFIGNKA